MNGNNIVEMMDTKYVYLDVEANTVITDGVLVAVNSDGNAVPAEKTDGFKVVGRAAEYVDNSNGVEGDKRITVKRGCFKYNNSTENPVTKANLFEPCYVEDSVTVSASSEGTSAAGIVISVEDDGVFVDTTTYIA